MHFNFVACFVSAKVPLRTVAVSILLGIQKGMFETRRRPWVGGKGKEKKEVGLRWVHYPKRTPNPKKSMEPWSELSWCCRFTAEGGGKRIRQKWGPFLAGRNTKVTMKLKK